MWADRPAPPLGKIEIQPIAYAGELAKDKLERLAGKLARDGIAHTVLTDPSSVAWTFNIRGSDVPHAPLPLAFAILAAEGPHYLFIDQRKLGIEAEGLSHPARRPARARRPRCRTRRALSAGGAKIGLDPALAAEHLRMLVEASGGKVVKPPIRRGCRAPRKNEAEIAGTRAAHRRDGAAVTKMLAWLDRQPPGSLDEITAVIQLEDFRRSTGEETQMPLREVSFDTISGAGPNGAIMHYRVSHASNRRLEPGELFLIDSGAQYQDGTTDITRTVAVGQPTEEMRERYTHRAQGHDRRSRCCASRPARAAATSTPSPAPAHWKAGIDYRARHRPWRRLVPVGA